MGATLSITLLYYTSNLISDYFANKVRYDLWRNASGKSIPIISVSQKPIDFGHNICVGDIGISSWNIYYQILTGAKVAKTKYIACCEDDSLYIPEHLAYRPKEDVFAYNVSRWNVNPKIYYYRRRAGMCTCIVATELLIDYLENRIKKYTREEYSHIKHVKYFGEPGRFEDKLGLPPVKLETFETEIPPLTFNHRPSYGGMRAILKTDITKDTLPYWGKAHDLWKRVHG